MSAYNGHTHLFSPETCELCSGMGWHERGPCAACEGRGKLALAAVHHEVQSGKIAVSVRHGGVDARTVEVEMSPDEARRLAAALLRDVGLIVDGVG